MSTQPFAGRHDIRTHIRTHLLNFELQNCYRDLQDCIETSVQQRNFQPGAEIPVIFWSKDHSNLRIRLYRAKDPLAKASHSSIMQSKKRQSNNSRSGPNSSKKAAKTQPKQITSTPTVDVDMTSSNAKRSTTPRKLIN